LTPTTLSMRLIALLALAQRALAVPLGNSIATAPGSAGPTLAPLQSSGELIEDSYIVVFKQGVDLNQIALHLSDVQQLHNANPLVALASDGLVDTGGINHVYMPSNSGIGYYGYAGTFSPATLDSIRATPEVAYVEYDQMVRTQDIPTGVDNWDSADTDLALKPTPNETLPSIVTDTGAPWGLARISHRGELKLSTFTKYVYDHDGGEGVTAYVIDTGINIHHVEFEGRATWGITIPKNDVDQDRNGHGTHCAGTIASKRYGVAKAAKVVAVKVLGSNGSGSMSDVIAGVVWAAEQAAAAAVAAAKELAATGRTKYKGSVANMSLGGGKSKSLDDAVNAAVETGLNFAVAAGNDNKDACNYSPAGAELAVTVGASTLSDERAYFSNYGECVDLFAPGLNILSTWTNGNETTNTISGTSMASPHVAGLLAYFLSIQGSGTFSIGNLDLDEASSTTSPVSLYTKAYSLLPRIVQAVLAAPVSQAPLLVAAEGDEFRPVPTPGNGTLTPSQLKKALIALASAGKLTDLPSGTPNLLAFNNATVPQKTK